MATAATTAPATQTTTSTSNSNLTLPMLVERHGDVLAVHMGGGFSIGDLAALALVSKALKIGLSEQAVLWRRQIEGRSWRLRAAPSLGPQVASNICAEMLCIDAPPRLVDIDWKLEFKALVRRETERRAEVLATPLSSWFERHIAGLDAIGVLDNGYRPEPWKRRFMVLVLSPAESHF